MKFGGKVRLLVSLACSVCLNAQESEPNVNAAEAKRPNILFVLQDDVSHASAYGTKWIKTPAFDRLAKEGILFTNAHTPSNKCAPSRAVIITGRNPWQLEAAANHVCYFPAQFKSLWEALGEQGYFTGHTGKGWGPGKATDADGNKRDLTGPEFEKIRIAKKDLLTSGIKDVDYAANFKDFLNQKPKDKPFLFWLGTHEAHRGYEFKSGTRLGKSIDDLEFMPPFFDDDGKECDVVKEDLLDYIAEVEYADMHLARALEHLEEVGELENTLIIATTDNGMPFPRYKGGPHEYATRLPFAAMWKGKIKNPGRRCDAFISFIDIAPTFLEAAGVTAEQIGMKPTQGKSLFDCFTDAPVGREYVLTGRERHDVGRPNDGGYPVRALIEGNYAYMHNFEPDRWPAGPALTGYRDMSGGPTKEHLLKTAAPGDPAFDVVFAKRPQEELYDIQADPFCMNNLAMNPEFKPLIEKMKEKLFAELEKQDDPRMFGKGDVFDSYEYANATKGLYERTMKGGAKKPGRADGKKAKKGK